MLWSLFGVITAVLGPKSLLHLTSRGQCGIGGGGKKGNWSSVFHLSCFWPFLMLTSEDDTLRLCASSKWQTGKKAERVGGDTAR